MNVYEHMTQEMIDCMIPQTELMGEWRLCRANELAASKAGRISLPAKAKSGLPVIHGARLAVMSIEEYWTDRRRLVELMLTPDTVYELEQEAKR